MGKLRGKRGFNEIVVDDAEFGADEKRFKSIPETYKNFTFAMSIAMMYPNPHKEGKRFFGILCVLAAYVPAYLMWFYDVYFCIRDFNLDDLTRQLTIGVPIMFCQFKMILITILRKQTNSILEEINADYERYNHLEDKYQRIVQENRESLLSLERIWTACCFICSGIFPAMATVSMIVMQLQVQDTKVMVHEIKIPIFENQKYESPCFEIVFAYMVFITFALAISFLGYDGMFFVCMYHFCLKMRLIAYKLGHAFEEPKDVEIIKKKIREVVEEQGETFRFIERIQSTYEVWLTMVLILTVIQICMDMFQIINDTGNGIDYRYVVFMVAAILHIYVPCLLAANVSASAEEVALAAYSSGWEDARDTSVRRSVAFIIARAQRPLWICPMNMVIFNMELFVCVLQKSYSVFTLLRPK